MRDFVRKVFRDWLWDGFIKHPIWGFVGVVLFIFVSFATEAKAIFQVITDYHWIFEATKWSCIVGALMFALHAYHRVLAITNKQAQLEKNINDVESRLQRTEQLPPAVKWLTGKEVMDKYGLSPIELYQYIKNGLFVYPKDFSEIMLEDEAQPLSEYDIGFEIEFDINHSGEMYDYLKSYHFKVLEVEQYLKSRRK